MEHEHFECSYCGECYEYEISLISHINIKHNYIFVEEEEQIQVTKDLNKEYKCPSCPKSYAVNSSLTRHFKKEHGNVEKILHNKRKFLRYKKSEEIIESFKCTLCDKSYVNSNSLDLHIKTKHNYDQKSLYNNPFTCFCSKVYPSKNALREHINIKHNNNINDEIEIVYEVDDIKVNQDYEGEVIL